LERYGDALLEAIRSGPPPPNPESITEPLRPSPSVSPSRPDRLPYRGPEPSSATVAYVPTGEWTWRLLDRGFTLDEAAAIRGLEPSAILRHATWVARQGKPVPLEAFLKPDVVARWDAWRREHGDDPPPSEPGGLWHLYLA